MQVQALLFDKDGTLFDFDATWSNWTIGVIEHFSDGDRAHAQRIADAIDFDLAARAYRPSSPIIAGTNRQAAELIAAVVPDWDVDKIETYLSISAGKAPLAPVVPLKPLMMAFRQSGLKLGVMTNDTEHSARSQLTSAGVFEAFDFVVGHDSGFGSKPDPDPLLAFASQIQIEPQQVVMVGDSTHDLIAGRRAGMRTVGVLTGPACEADLREFADVVLPDIGHLHDWLKIA